MLLAGDVGGTKTRLAIFNEHDLKDPVKEEKYRSEDFTSLTDIIKLFLSETDYLISTACIGIPGPVSKGRSQTTNLPWIIDEKELSKELKIPYVHLVNDLQANAYGVMQLGEKEFYTLNKGNSSQVGNAALVAPGTGLGEAGLFWDGQKHIPFASEGGHVDFAPHNELEFELYRYLQKKFGHVSYERVLSGPGIYNIYQFLVDVKKEEDSLELDKNKHDIPRVITEKGMNGENKTCEKVIDLFVSFFAAEAANIALTLFTLGGIYLCGGIVPNVLERLKEGKFMKAFIDKGRFASFMKSIPVKAVLNIKTPIIGAAYIAKKKLEQ